MKKGKKKSNEDLRVVDGKNPAYPRSTQKFSPVMGKRKLTEKGGGGQVSGVGGRMVGGGAGEGEVSGGGGVGGRGLLAK